ncbi:exported protein of unknown function [Methanoculleus bourgensis]|uniref:Uncharacterized protein n=1 Tax=Methanoculleus bourgensis TaxID=83986 RepID=A0A0X3BJL9_9EURY|nr:exported protein of unknown function [Methanoculleus bourgensis]
MLPRARYPAPGGALMPGAAVAGPVAARDLKIEGVKSSCPSGLPSAGCHAPGRRIYRAYGGCGGVLVCSPAAPISRGCPGH